MDEDRTTIIDYRPREAGKIKAQRMVKRQARRDSAKSKGTSLLERQAIGDLDLQGRSGHDVLGKGPSVRLQRITWTITISDGSKSILGGDPTSANRPCHSISSYKIGNFRSYRLDRAGIVTASHSPLNGVEVDMLPVGGVERDRMNLDQHPIHRDIWDRVRFNNGFSGTDAKRRGIQAAALMMQEVKHGVGVWWWILKNDNRSIYVHNLTRDHSHGSPATPAES